jgi:hypothetical protein
MYETLRHGPLRTSMALSLCAGDSEKQHGGGQGVRIPGVCPGLLYLRSCNASLELVDAMGLALRQGNASEAEALGALLLAPREDPTTGAPLTECVHVLHARRRRRSGKLWMAGATLAAWAQWAHAMPAGRHGFQLSTWPPTTPRRCTCAGAASPPLHDQRCAVWTAARRAERLPGRRPPCGHPYGFTPRQGATRAGWVSPWHRLRPAINH